MGPACRGNSFSSQNDSSNAGGAWWAVELDGWSSMMTKTDDLLGGDLGGLAAFLSVRVTDVKLYRTR